MKAKELYFKFILVTIPDAFDINPYVSLLQRDGTLVTVGMLGPYKKGTDNNEVAFHRRNIAGSLIGGIAETQEVLDFCAEHNILPEVEIIRMEDINDAFDRMQKGEVRFRYVIDMASLREEGAR
jgi:alcohol dehydrogenase (NADP+)